MIKRDLTPWLLLPIVALAMLPLMSFSTWLTLTIAGAAMGMMLFLMASGLTLVFGLMDVMNFAHGAFITLGAYLAVTVLGRLSGWGGPDSLAWNLAALAVAVTTGAIATGAVGAIFERVIIRRVYGSHLQQILITMGGLIVAGQLVIVIWGAQPLQVAKPTLLRGSFLLAGAAIESYRLVAVALGLAVFAIAYLVLNRTRIGLLVRAGVENREMVEALGFRIERLFVAVFVAGAALAGIGGVMWGGYQEVVTATIGDEMTVLIFIVIIIGGLGSTLGCLVGALLVGLVANYVGFLAPKAALFSNIGLMVAILLWRPQGLYPVGAK
jgi:branched-chain amino acid transport system permease protein